MASKIDNVILGYGQVGQAILANMYEKPKTYDVGQWENLEDTAINYLHICIPYTDKFLYIVEQAVKKFNPKIVVIHSTVKPGTTCMIGLNVLYSPVLGRHADNFSENIKGYVKYFAGNENDYDEVKKQFNLKTEFWGINTSELEYAKVMSTTRMYWELYYQKIMQKDCEKYGYKFDDVYNRWTDNYNKGLVNDHPDWQRPNYDKMDTDTPGGHCLNSNIHLVDNDITKYLKAYEKGILYYVTKNT